MGVNQTTPQWLLSTALFLGTTGCGLILGERSQNLSLTANPAGVEVSIKGRTQPAPATIMLTKGRHDRSPFVMRGRKPGYYDACQIVEFDTNGFLIALDAIPVALGLAIDAMAGTWPGSFPERVHLDLRPRPSGYVDMLPDDRSILNAKESSLVDFCNPSPELQEWMDLRSRYSTKAAKVIVASGEISRQYRILGRVDVDARGVNQIAWSYWRIGGFSSFNITTTQHKENPIVMNELLTYQALKKYGDLVDAIINVHYETQPSLDVFAGGIAVHFETATAPASSPPTSTSGSSEERLLQLRKLREQNLISPEEYEEKRKRILDAL